jgi:hypothetical protein
VQQQQQQQRIPRQRRQRLALEEEVGLVLLWRRIWRWKEKKQPTKESQQRQ